MLFVRHTVRRFDRHRQLGSQESSWVARDIAAGAASAADLSAVRPTGSKGHCVCRNPAAQLPRMAPPARAPSPPSTKTSHST